MLQARSPSTSPLPLRVFHFETALPWTSAQEEDARFTRLLRIGLGVFLVLGLAVTLIPVPELTREQTERIPPQLARVILEKKELPVDKKPPEPKPRPEEKAQEKPREKPQPKPPQPKPPQPEQKPEPARLEQARQRAASSGLLQLQDELQDMRESVSVADVSSGELSRGESSAGNLDRALIADRARTSSGGVNTAQLSRDTGGSALAARETTQVQNVQAERAAGRAIEQAQRQRSPRGEESIRSVMEANKGAIFAIYNRALRSDPTLRGKVTVQLVIEADGSISAVRLVSSELNDPELERRLLARIRLINFGSANVDRATLNYSIDFLPS